MATEITHAHCGVPAKKNDEGLFYCPKCSPEKARTNKVGREKLGDRMREINARWLASAKGPNGSVLDFWATAKGVYVVQEYADGNGFEVFKQATDKNDWASTLAAIE